MKMRKVDVVIWFSNIFFYMGLLFLLLVSRNNEIYFYYEISRTLMIAGILATIVPDILINLGYEGIKKYVYMTSLISKIIIFISAVWYLSDKNIVAIEIGYICIFILDIVCSCSITKQLRNISMKDCFENISKVQVGNADKMLIINIFVLAFCISLSCESIRTLALGIILCSIGQLGLIKILIKEIQKLHSDINIIKLKLVAWSIYIGIVVVTVCEMNKMIGYVLCGLYWMIWSDIIVPKKTSLRWMTWFKNKGKEND